MAAAATSAQVDSVLPSAASRDSAPNAREDSPTMSPPLVSPSALPEPTKAPEVSMVEASDFTGVTFTPELWVQRRHWALDVLRQNGVRSVLDIGCGPGSLLQTLVEPPPTVPEPPICSTDPETKGEAPDGRELFISRLGGVDFDPAVMNTAIKMLETPEEEDTGAMPKHPRWEPMGTEVWLGNIERYNARFEGFEAICALELIEHLEPNLLSRFGVVTLGTYRPRLLLVTTPNFDFNSKFPDHMHDECGKRGFVDPTGRTERVFRHSDHKCEMTSAEFHNWANAAAADWGYTVEISGVGISSSPSYYPAEDGQPPRPIYASQTAVFRLASGVPMRSPRSVRTVELPFMRGASEASHPHRLAFKSVHNTTALVPKGAPLSCDEVVAAVAAAFKQLGVPSVSLTELWALPGLAGVCAGSKRHLVSSLGGWGDCPPAPGSAASAGFEVFRDQNGLGVRKV